eukprot:COSAG01_NODE_931_length_12617_cov_20.567163_7_plen_317_part_00
MTRSRYVDLSQAPPHVSGGGGSRNAFVDYLGFRATVEFCTRHRLPVDSAIIATGANALTFMQSVSAQRDHMTDSLFEQLLRGGAVPGVTIIEGTVSHAEVLGDTLEGLVIHQHVSPPQGRRPGQQQDGAVAVAPTADEIVAAIDRGDSIIEKFKFPYTVRTMCLRPALGDAYSRGQAEHQRSIISLEAFADLVHDWSRRWCMTDSGRDFWSAFAWDCMRYAKEEPDRFPFTHPSLIALHIRLADHVAAVGVRSDTKAWVEAHVAQRVLLCHAATVEWLFVRRAFPLWNRSILTEIYLCHAYSYHEFEDGNGRAGEP